MLHSFEQAVNAFAKEMKAKLRYKQADGWGGWTDAACTEQFRRDLLHHVATGDPVDVANYAMFLWNLGERTMPQHVNAAPPPSE